MSTYRFLLPEDSVAVGDGETFAEVLQDHGDWQLVAVSYWNTHSSKSTYRAYDDRVEPVSYQLTGNVMVMLVLIFLLPVALLLSRMLMAALS